MAATDTQKGCEEPADCPGGGPDAFEHLICEHQRMIYSLCYRMTGSAEDAEDLAQETFLRGFHQLSSFRAEAKLSSWLCRIAINLCLNWRKREGRRHEVHTRWVDACENPVCRTRVDLLAAGQPLPTQQVRRGNVNRAQLVRAKGEQRGQ